MSSSLPAHRFVAEVTDRSKDRLLAATEHVRKNLGREAEAQAENRDRMSVSDRYENRVLQRTFGLLNTVRALEDAQRMIRVFPAQVGRGRDAVSRDRWVDYHYGYFTVSLASIPDVAVLLTATVFQLGIAPKHCTANIVVSSESIKGTPVVTALRALGRSVQEVKERRNRHVHRGEHAEVDGLSSDTLLRDLKTMTFLQSIRPTLVDRNLMRDAWREAVKEFTPRLEEESKQVGEAISVVLDALLAEFTSRSDLLRKLAKVTTRGAV